MLISSLRYSIYKVQTRFLLRRKLLDYITLKTVCQELFSSFFELFRGDFPRCRFREQLGHFITSFLTCQELFSILFEVFRAVALRSKLPLFITQLLYYTLSISICQELFSNSQKFPLISALFYCPRGQLRYNTISFSICQAFFHKNWHLFLCAFNTDICTSIVTIP